MLSPDLLSAVHAGRLDAVRQLHQSGADLRIFGAEALRLAAVGGHLEVLCYLHQNGVPLAVLHDEDMADIAERGHLPVIEYLHRHGFDLRKNTDTLFRRAAGGGHLPVVRYLHHNGAAIDACNNEPLLLAAEQGHLEIVRYLHRNGANLRIPQREALRRATAAGHAIVVRYLRENGGFVPDPSESPGATQRIRLSYWEMPAAVVSGDLPAVRHLYEAGILGNGEETLLLAAANGHMPIVRYLHHAGCDLREIGHQALLLAVANGRLEVVEYLHEKGCDITAGNNAAVRTAAAENQPDILRYLHWHGADLRACADVWKTLALSPAAAGVVDYLALHGLAPEGPKLMALLHAIRIGSLPAVKKALEYLDVGFYSGMLAKTAAERGDVGILRLLHQKGCDVLADNHVAFRTAAARGHVGTLVYLHDNGADLHAGIDEALRLAAENGHIHAVAMLAQLGANIKSIDEPMLMNIQFNGHTRTFNYLTDSGLDAIGRHRPAIAAMHEELRTAKSVYRPSKLWEYFNEVNLEQLRRGGMQNFKRSINQNYFNFLPYSLLDPQLSRLARWWLSHLSTTPFRAKAFDPDIITESRQLLAIDRRALSLEHRYPILSWVARKTGIDLGRKTHIAINRLLLAMPESRQLLAIDRRVFSLGHRYRILSWVTRKTGIDLGRKAQIALYRLLLAMLWDYACAHDRLGLAERLSEPRIGAPIDVYVGSRLISQDLAHSILECNSILAEINPEDLARTTRIAEVGAGYGRLGYVLMKAVECQYVVFDIPPGLYVSQWYLGVAFPGKRIFRFRHFERFEDIAAELSQADIAFFSPNQIEMFPEGFFDITANISSLHELRPDQIDNMLTQIYRITRRYVYLKQYKEYINPYDDLRILEDSYRVAPGWKHRYYRDDGVDARFFETLIEREAVDLPAQAPHVLPAALNAAAPTVSILLANYNHARYLPTALAGICGQNHPALEIIVVDDGSTDDSIAVIEEFARRFPNIRLLRNGINRGQHHSIQRALLAAHGDYIVWAASDDLLLPDFLERSVAVLKAHPGAGVCFSRLGVFVDGTSEVRRYDGLTQGAAFDYGDTARLLPPEELKETLSRHYIWMSGNTVLARRSALLEISGFESRLKWHADWFAYYVVALRYGACIIPETLALMRERRDTYSRTGMENPREQSRVLKSLFDAVKSPKYRDLLPVFLRCPSLLGLFGRRALYTAMRHPRHWDLVPELGWWLNPCYLLRVYGRIRHELSARFHRWRAASRS